MYFSSKFLYRKQIRQLFRKQRKILLQEKKNLLAQQAAERVLSLPILFTARTIALFLPFDGEIDTFPIIKQLWKMGKKTYLPALHIFSPGNLLFLRYHLYSKLVINKFKIYEPKLDVRDVLPLSDLNLLITPLVAFDKNGQRLGMGGGFYDRTLQNWEKHGFYPIGYAYDFQLVDALPTEEWDIQLPAVVTPSKVWVW